MSDYALVEYPGIVKHVDKALLSLGGIEAIASVTVFNLKNEFSDCFFSPSPEVARSNYDICQEILTKVL